MTIATSQAGNRLLLPILTLGVVGIIPIIAEHFNISVPDAG